MPHLKPAVLLAAILTSLALAVPAQADIDAGVVDDTPVVTADGGAAFFALMSDVGLKEVRITVQWDPANPTTIGNEAYLAAMVPVATLRGVRVVFSVQQLKARSVTGTPNGTQQFAAFVAQLATTFPTVHDFIVGNEPNLSRFWQPQFNGNRSAAPAAYQALLARSYDALKAVNPTNNVIGLGLSPRGNDAPHAPGNVSHSPVKFLSALGAAYRASGRRKPLMDMFAFHPYPKTDRDPLAKGYPWPNAGVPNLGRIKQAFFDGFHGTSQKTFEQGLKMKLDEVGWQVGVVPGSQGAYFGQESIQPTDEQSQASIYAALLRQVACDPAVDAVLFFGFQDEPNLDRWQSGLMRADGSKRASYDSVKATLAQTGGRCAGKHAELAPLDGARRRQRQVLQARPPAQPRQLVEPHRPRRGGCAVRCRHPSLQRPPGRARADQDRPPRRPHGPPGPAPVTPPPPRPLCLLDPLPRRGEPGPHDAAHRQAVHGLPRPLAPAQTRTAESQVTVCYLLL